MQLTEQPVTTFPTRSGHLVEVIEVTASRATSMDEAAAASGPIWRCTGCRDGSDKPLNHKRFGDPTAIVTAAASAHSQFCTA
jgi:hypothetical protein